MGSIMWEREVAEIYDRTYAQIFEPDVLGPMVDFLGDSATVIGNEHPVTAAHILGVVRHAESRTGQLMGQPLLAAIRGSALATLGPVRFEQESRIGSVAKVGDVFDEVRAILEEDLAADERASAAPS